MYGNISMMSLNCQDMNNLKEAQLKEIIWIKVILLPVANSNTNNKIF